MTFNKVCSRCKKSTYTAPDHVLFEVWGNIMAENIRGCFGGIIGGNIATTDEYEKWESQRDVLVAISDDTTVRVYSLIYCKDCLTNAIMSVNT